MSRSGGGMRAAFCLAHEQGSQQLEAALAARDFTTVSWQAYTEMSSRFQRQE